MKLQVVLNEKWASLVVGRPTTLFQSPVWLEILKSGFPNVQFWAATEGIRKDHFQGANILSTAHSKRGFGERRLNIPGSESESASKTWATDSTRDIVR